VAQLHEIVNEILKTHTDTRRRRLQALVPRVIPLTPRMRLLVDTGDQVSLADMLQQERRDADSSIVDTIEEWASTLQAAREQAAREHSDEDAGEVEAAARRAALQHMQRVISPTIITNYVQARCRDPDAYFAFRTRLSYHYGLHSLLAYMLNVGERTPDKLLFAFNTADVVSLEFRPVYMGNGTLLGAAEPVPFRLTPNLQVLFTPFGVSGSFAASFTAVARCLTRRENWLHPYFTLFLRGDLLSWHANRVAPVCESEQRVLEAKLKDRAVMNVRYALQRMREVQPIPSVPMNTEQQQAAIHSMAGKSSAASGSSSAGGEAKPETASMQMPEHYAPGAAPLTPNPSTTNYNGHVFTRIAAATSEDNLAQMPASWQPWF
jgi:transformation/transcription domain-associated protein